jgi:hypothetical protein
MTNFWISAGPIVLGVAAFFIGNELRRIQKELVELRNTQHSQAVDIAKIAERIK